MKPVTESFDNVQKIEISEKPKTLIECKSRLWDIWRTMTTLYEDNAPFPDSDFKQL